MTEEEAFLQAMRVQPDDLNLRLVFADWLEEQGDPRGELLRLAHALTEPTAPFDRLAKEIRLRNLLTEGVLPIGPTWSNSIGMPFIWVPRGSYLMGSPLQEANRQDDEIQHRVTLTRGFFMSVSPVTQGQWQAVMNANPSCAKGPDCPVEGISWQDCQEFCQALALKEGLADVSPRPYRLPTEAEWEYACRGATGSPFSFGDTLSTDQANYHANYTSASKSAGKHFGETTPAGSFPANAWGLADMHGNVFEWCSDWYGSYSAALATDPAGKAAGNVRVLRGGSWHSLWWRCRSACRGWGAPAYRGSDVGCRICFRLDLDFQI